MRFKLDENLPAPAAGVLTCAGYDAGTVTGDGLQGVPDPTWLPQPPRTGGY